MNEKEINRELVEKIYQEVIDVAYRHAKEHPPDSPEILVALAMAAGGLCSAYSEPGLAFHSMLQTAGLMLSRVDESFHFAMGEVEQVDDDGVVH